VSTIYEDELTEQQEADAAVKALARRNMEMKRLRDRMRKLRNAIMGKPVMHGVNIGVVIKRVDEASDDIENICYAHEFSAGKNGGRIRWSRESNARVDQCNAFDETSAPDAGALPFRSNRARELPEIRHREEEHYKKQITLAIGFAKQWAEHMRKQAEVEAQKRALDAEATGQ